MKKRLDVILENKGDIRLNDVYSFFESTEDILLIKYDGARKDDKYTIVLMGKNSSFEMIRYEGKSLQDGLYKILVEYRNTVE